MTLLNIAYTIYVRKSFMFTSQNTCVVFHSLPLCSLTIIPSWYLPRQFLLKRKEELRNKKCIRGRLYKMRLLIMFYNKNCHSVDQTIVETVYHAVGLVQVAQPQSCKVSNRWGNTLSILLIFYREDNSGLDRGTIKIGN